jgi:hypothetical protein
MLIDRRRLIRCASAIAGQGLVAAAFAQNWPGRAIVIIVPFPAGGSADLSARLLAEKLKAVFGQTVVIENKPGAGGNLAAAEAARAEPDGYTLFIGTNGTQTINQSLYRQLTYDPRADFAPIAIMWSAPHLLVASIGTSTIARGIYCLRTRPPGLAELRFVRNRILDAFVWGDVQSAHRHRHSPRAVSRPGSGA